MHPSLKRKNYVAPAVHFREISQFLFYFISICLEDLKAYSFESHVHARSNVGTWPQLGSGSHDHSPAYEVSDKQYKETRAMGDGDAARFMILGIRHYGQLTQQQENSLVDRSE